MDFVVDLDEIWVWLGFNQKINAIRTLEKHFKLDIDYKNLSPQLGGASLEEKSAPEASGAVSTKHGGHNKQPILLTIKCFKSLCLKAQTKKASEIHEYYMKLEEVLQEIVEEETDELRLQLEKKEATILEKETTILEIKQSSNKEKQKAVEQAIVVQFPLNTECIYFGTIDNTNEAGETLIKFGHTNDLSTRLTDHRKKYDNFVLVNAFRVQNKVEIENLIKQHPKIKRQIRSIELNGKNKTEIIAYDATFTIEKLSKHIKDIIHSKTYSIDNFNRIMKENEELQTENRMLTQQVKTQEGLIEKQAIEISQLKKEKKSLNLQNKKTFLCIKMYYYLKMN